MPVNSTIYKLSKRSLKEIGKLSSPVCIQETDLVQLSFPPETNQRKTLQALVINSCDSCIKYKVNNLKGKSTNSLEKFPENRRGRIIFQLILLGQYYLDARAGQRHYRKRKLGANIFHEIVTEIS